MPSVLRRIRRTASDLVPDTRAGFTSIDASPARYDDGSWLKPRS